MCMPRDPDVFGHPTRPRSVSVACTTRATSRTCDHSIPGYGIQVYAELVGMIEIVGSDRMRMQLETREVGHPEQGPPHLAARLLPRSCRTGSGGSPPRSSQASTLAPASGKRTLPRCRWDSARGRWGVLPRRATRPPPRRSSTAPDPASCVRPAETAPSRGSRSPPRARQPSGSRDRSVRPWILRLIQGTQPIAGGSRG